MPKAKQPKVNPEEITEGVVKAPSESIKEEPKKDKEPSLEEVVKTKLKIINF